MGKSRIKGTSFFLYIGFFIIAASLLMLQILYSRALSVAFGFGFEFIIVSLVILGIGIGGILVFFLFNNLKSSNQVNSLLIITSLIYGISIPVSFLVLKPGNNFSVFLFLIVGFLTYVLAGIIASVLFRYYARKISKLYFLSLLGSALGTLGAVVFLELFSMPINIILLVIFSSFSILLFTFYARPGKKLLISITALIFVIPALYWIGLENYLQIVCPSTNERPIATKSDALSRIDVYLDDESHYKIMRNCHSRTLIFNYNTLDENQLYKDALIYFPFPTENFSSALMIGSAGGRGVIQAVEAGIPDITAIEINPLVVESTELLKRSDNIYYHDSVELFVREGRAFISTSKEKYDLIYLLGLSLGRIGYGAHLLSESYLYTKEALDSYFRHLDENGILAIGVGKQSLPSITETAVISLLEKGIDPNKRIILFEDTIMNGKPRGLILVKNSDFSKIEGDSIIKKAAELGLGARFLTLTKADSEYYRNGRAMTDDQPYFLVHELYGQEGGNMRIRGTNIIIPSVEKLPVYFLKYILLLLIIILLSYVLTVAVPLYKLKDLRSYNILYLLGFFSAIGIGFITFELSFIHKFTLFLGHPVLSFSVTLASVLFFGGLGSLATGKFKEGDIPLKIAKIIFILVLFIILFILSINFALSKLIFLDIAYKILFAISVLSLPSLLMGMIFPLGLKMAKRTSEKIIPWMVGIDGITSVLGGTLAFVISLMFGFNAALIFGALVYSFALLMALRMR